MKTMQKATLTTAVAFLLILSGINNALAWTWGDVAVDIAKGVVIGVIVKSITQPSDASTKEPQQYSPTVQSNPVIDKYSSMRSIAVAHFQAESQCNMNAIMSFYNDPVYYEGNEKRIDDMRKTKEAVCKNRGEAHFYIKDNNIIVSDFANDSTIKLLDYDVNFDVFNIKKQERSKGTARVRLAIRNDKVIGEFHKTLTRDVIGQKTTFANAISYVCGLDSSGDDFLSLREGPNKTYPEILQMEENTPLVVLEKQGSWYRVQMNNGTIGWAFGRWIC